MRRKLRAIQILNSITHKWYQAHQVHSRQQVQPAHLSLQRNAVRAVRLRDNSESAFVRSEVLCFPVRALTSPNRRINEGMVVRLGNRT